MRKRNGENRDLPDGKRRLAGLKQCVEYLKSMPEEESIRIAEDYRRFCREYERESTE